MVDVTGTEEPWAAASARRTTDPGPLRPSKRLPAKLITVTALAEARKGKKTLTERTAAGSSAAPPKKPTGDGERASGPTRRISRCPRRLRDPGRRHQWRRQDQPTHRQLRSARRRQRSGPTAASTCEPSCRHSSPACADAETVPTAQSRTSAAAPDQVTVDMVAQLYALKAEVQQLRVLVAHQTPAESSIAAYARGAVASVTSPNAKGEIPPAELCYLTSASSPEGAKKAKGDYNPPQAHLLAASRMFRAFETETGKLLTAMSFVLWMWELESVKFHVTPAVLLAIFSGRLGSRGPTLMHLRRELPLKMVRRTPTFRATAVPQRIYQQLLSSAQAMRTSW
ncbi:hypothetical protein PI125_g18016 [Phytophthora idaei]|nr:hypothetical protein PI125_g18016 [Phytophthora idaei]